MNEQDKDMTLKTHQGCINDGVTEEQLQIANEQVLFTAIMCHEANRAYCQSIGDDSMLPWNEAPESAKDDAIDGVHFFLTNTDGYEPEGMPPSIRTVYFVCRAIVRTMLGGGEA